MKKSFKNILITTLIAAAGFGTLAACNETTNKVHKDKEYLNILSTQAVTSMETILKGGYLNNAKRLAKNLETSTEVIPNESTSSSEIDRDVLSTFEEILNQGKVVVKENLDFEVTDSDLEGYNYLVTISNNNEIYKMYLESLREKIEDYGEEYEFTYKGIIKYQSQEFTFLAKEEVEFDKEDNEEESEIEFKVTIDETKSLVIKQEIEVENDKEENEFKYALYENKKIVKSYKIEKEDTKNGYEVKVEINGYEFKINYNEALKKVVIKTNKERYEFDYDEKNLESNKELKEFIETLKTNMENNPHIFDKDEDDDD